MIAHDAALALISARLDTPLSLAESRELQTHLATCAECRRFAEQAETLAGELRVFPRLGPSPNVSRRVMVRIEAGRSPWGGWRRGLQLASSPVTAVASGFVLVAALTITVFLALNSPGSGRLDAPLATQIGVAFAQTATATPTEPPSPTATPVAAVTAAPAIAPTESPLPTSTPTPTAQTNVTVTVTPTPRSAPVTTAPTATTAPPVADAATAPPEPARQPTSAPAPTAVPTVPAAPTGAVPTAPAPTAMPASTEAPAPTEPPAIVVVRTPRPPEIMTPRPPNTPIPPAVPVVIDPDVAVADARGAVIASAVPPGMIEADAALGPTPSGAGETDSFSPPIVPRVGETAVDDAVVPEAAVIPDTGAVTTVDGDGTIGVGESDSRAAPAVVESAAATGAEGAQVDDDSAAIEAVSVGAVEDPKPTATPGFPPASPVPAGGGNAAPSGGGVRIDGAGITASDGTGDSSTSLTGTTAEEDGN